MAIDNQFTLTQSMFNAMCDPSTHAPFVQAQILDCGNHHSVSLKTALEMFSKMADAKAEKTVQCPWCLKPVTRYDPNPALQNLVDSILGTNKEKMLAIVKKFQGERYENAEYPLAPSKFHISIGFDDYISNQKSKDWLFRLTFCHENQRDPNAGCLQLLVMQGWKNVDYTFELYFYNLRDKLLFKPILLKYHDNLEITIESETSIKIWTKDPKKALDFIGLLQKYNKFDKKCFISVPQESALAFLEFAKEQINHFAKA